MTITKCYKYDDFKNNTDQYLGKLFKLITLDILTGKYMGICREGINLNSLKFKVNTQYISEGIFYVSEQTIQQNMIKIHDNTPKNFVCHKCNKVFKGQSGLWYHNKHHHQVTNANDNINQKYYKMPKYWPFLWAENSLDSFIDTNDNEKIINKKLIRLFKQAEGNWNKISEKKKERNKYKEWVYNWRSSKKGKNLQKKFKKYSNKFKSKLDSNYSEYQYHLYDSALIIQKMFKNKNQQ